MRECDGLLSEVWINTVQHSEKLMGIKKDIFFDLYFNLLNFIIGFFQPFGGVLLRECDGLLSEVWINTVQHSEELICNSMIVRLHASKIFYY